MTRVVWVLGLLGGCAGRSEPASHDEARDTLVIARPIDVGAAVPVLPQNVYDWWLVHALNLSLLEPRFDCRLSFEPGLARSWSFSEDGTVLTMELAEGITWEDGRPVTAEDVAFAAEVARDPAVASTVHASTKALAPGSPVVVDATHLEWRFTSAGDRTQQLQHVSSIGAMPKHLLADADRATIRGHAAVTSPIGDGRWRLASRVPNDRVVLEPNEAFAGPPEERPKLDRVIFRVIPEYAARVVALENGELDVVIGLDVEDAERLRRDRPDLVIHRRPARGGITYVAWNARRPDGTPHPILSDRAVRRAFAKAIDVERVIADYYTGAEPYAQRAVGTTSPTICDEVPAIEPFPYDPAAARAELDAAGWKDLDGDGVREKDGAPMRLTLTARVGEELPVILQAQLRDVGVDLAIEPLEGAALLGRTRRREYEAALATYSGDLTPDHARFWRSGDDVVFNVTSYANPRVDELIDALAGEADPERRRATSHEIQRLVYDDQPFLFLYWRDDLVAVHERFRDAQVDALAPHGSLHRWWVPPDEVKYRR